MGTRHARKYRGIWAGQAAGADHIGDLRAPGSRGDHQRLYLPAPSQVFRELFKLFGDGEIWKHLYVTLAEFVTGYSIALGGLAVGTALVLIPGRSSSSDRIFRR